MAATEGATADAVPDHIKGTSPYTVVTPVSHVLQLRGGAAAGAGRHIQL